ncbi:MAG: DUF4492 domain-containing protein [Bacteroidales bacterium]|jgi:Na+/H+ antiporter NhaD/arsenite permease-like protein|nr:DUF4492 domain-containing protein [Bacteroidales bacterium]
MNTLKKIWNFYYEGIRSMTLGKTLWALVLIKLFIMFVILRIFFFKPALADYETEEQKSEAVIEQLTK